MSNEIQTQQRRPPTLRQRVQSMSASMLVDMVGEEQSKAAAARVSLAFAAAHRAARNPADLERCSPESIASAVALSALTGLMPGGAMPAVWLVPRNGELQWMPSHRGLMTLCQRAGYQLIPVVVGPDDEIVAGFGEVESHTQCVESPPTGLDDMQGVIVSVRRIADGIILGRYLVSAPDIRKRAAARGSGPVWKSWPLEMAMKSAIKWVCARGLVPIEGMELNQALAADTRAETAEPGRATVHAAPRKAIASPSATFALDAPQADAPTIIDAEQPDTASQSDSTPASDADAGDGWGE